MQAPVLLYQKLRMRTVVRSNMREILLSRAHARDVLAFLASYLAIAS